jgi:hypothetical protein
MNVWKLRQKLDTPVVISHLLLHEPRELAYAMLDFDDNWSIFSKGDEQKQDAGYPDSTLQMSTVSLAKAVELFPQLEMLSVLPKAIVGNWRAEDEGWMLSFLDPRCIKDYGDVVPWLRVWDASTPPAQMCTVSKNLVTVTSSWKKRKPVIEFCSRSKKGEYYFIAEGDTEYDKSYGIQIREAAMLYQEILDMLRVDQDYGTIMEF